MGWRFLSEKGRTTWTFITEDGVQQRLGWPDQQLKDLSEYVRQDCRNPNDFTFNRTKNPNSCDMILRSLMLDAGSRTRKILDEDAESDVQKQAFNVARQGLAFYERLQQPDGFWAGDYGGPLFLMPGLIFSCYCTGVEIPDAHALEMSRYIRNHQQPMAGWGLHIEMQHSTAFGTVLNYVALRILGADPTEPAMKHALKCLHALGGCGVVPAWGKFWLAVLGLYDWEGLDTLMPDLWALPEALPMHPSNFWCHSRMVCLPMAYLYGRRYVMPINQLIKEIRCELYPEGYANMCWHDYRGCIASVDVYTPPHPALKLFMKFANLYERFHSGWLRKRALKFMYEYICMEDEHTDFIDIGPVSKCINMLCRFVNEGPESVAFERHARRIGDYIWLAEDGMKMQGYNGSQLWDTAWAGLAITESRLAQEFLSCSVGVYRYLEMTQIVDEVEQRQNFYRHISRGAWPFSTRAHGWPVADTAALGLQSLLELQAAGVDKHAPKIVPIAGIFDCVNVLLTLQNKNGGWATYELQRAPSWLEMLNPSGVFKDIIVDICYVELTSSCLQALKTFSQHFPGHRSKEIQTSLLKGLEFIKSKQRPDGGFYGSWAVCFCYGTWFAVEALSMCGGPEEQDSIRRAGEFLLRHQNPDGGWGESHLSSTLHEYVPEKSQVVNTSWALLALMAANSPDVAAIKHGITNLMQKQQDNGDWEQEGISGVFNANCMITYTSYRNVFPIRALGRFAHWKGLAEA